MDDYKEKILKVCNESCANTLMETLGITFTELGPDYLQAEMEVSPRVHQPDGVLHGGASVALAESVASMATFVFMDASKFFVRGIEISANHVRAIKDGTVIARATALHKGRTTQVWEIRITNTSDELISHCKLTTIALPKKS